MIFCYETDTGEIIEKPFPIGKAPRTVNIDGVVARKLIVSPGGSTPNAGNWPMVNVMGGVNPEQAAVANERLRALGAPGHYDHKTGDLHLETRKDYREHCRLTGKVNGSAGYGDWAGDGGKSASAAQERAREIQRKGS